MDLDKLEDRDLLDHERHAQGITTLVTNFLYNPRDRRPARDRYFLSQEVEQGDPLCLEDPADATTESDIHPSDNWDSDDTQDEDEFDPDEDMEDMEMVQKDYNMSPQTLRKKNRLYFISNNTV